MNDGPLESAVADGNVPPPRAVTGWGDRRGDPSQASPERPAETPTARRAPPPADCVCQTGRVRAALREDLDRYVFVVQQQQPLQGMLVPLRIGMLSQGMWATTAYRWHHYAQHRVRSRWLRVLPYVVHRAVMALTGIHIDSGAHIGAGLSFAHGGPTVIGPVLLGKDCDIYQGVTIGAGMNFDERIPMSGFPALGDRVWVGPGAVVAGGVTLGNDVAVGANSLVVRDVPARGVMIGVPARLVSRSGSFAQVLYRGMDRDPERLAARAADPQASPGRAG